LLHQSTIPIAHVLMLQMRRSRIMLTLLHAYSTSVEALDDLGHNIMSNGWSRLSSLGRGGAIGSSSLIVLRRDRPPLEMCSSTTITQP